jgi:hypothetical protein
MMLTQVWRERPELGSPRTAAGAICTCILCIILLAGLWPFRAPKNDVRWLHGESGIMFGDRGIVVSAQALQANAHQGPCSLEICLRPPRAFGSGTILAVDDYPDPRYVFALRQFDAGMAVQRPAFDRRGELVRQWWKTNNVFEAGKRVVLTITGSQGKTVLYVNGIAANVSSEFNLSGADLSGKLILGNSAIQDNWHGDLMGLAIYDHVLTPPQIEIHAGRWLRGQTPVLNGDEVPAVLYRFDEGSGSIVHDRGSGSNSLLIRPRYFILHPAFLEPLWKPFRSRWDGWMTRSYWSDVIINIVGFIPFGFFFALRFSLSPAIRSPRMMALLLGVAISLAIETLQYFLPTRDSSMTDLLNNSIGTAIGVAFCRPSWMHRLYGRMHGREPHRSPPIGY